MASTRGILRPHVGFKHFDLDRVEPPDDLRPFLGMLWTVHWDLPEETEFNQEILPFPRVNLAFEEGLLNVHGPAKARFVATLKGRGWVAGARFRPAGFYALAIRPMRDITDKVLPAIEATGLPAPPFPSQASAARAELLDYVRACLRDVDVGELEQVNQWVDRAQDERGIATAADLAEVAGVSVRTLHRTLEKYVGVSSKWIVRRARIQQCADRVAQGERVDWAQTAQELGYHDQAHLIRDFKDQVGLTPKAYAEKCST